MSVNWATYEFGIPSCLPCCDQPVPPGECQCALLIPPFASPYADYATAETAIADNSLDCLLFSVTPIADYDSFSLTPGTDSYAVAASSVGENGEPQEIHVFMAVAMVSGSVLTVDFSGTITPTGTTSDYEWSVDMSFLDCSGNVLDEFNDTAATATISGSPTFTAPADGLYYIEVQLQGNADFEDTAPDYSFDCDFSADDVMLAQPVIALWDDSGTTRQLEACPRLYLPPLTESTGDWYADETEAQAAIDDNAVSCIGYFEPDLDAMATWSAQTATGGTTLNLAGVLTGDAPSALIYGSFNADGGDTITLAYSVDTDDSVSSVVTVSVFDSDGAGVFSDTDSGAGTVSDSFTFSAPHTGRFIALIQGAGNTGDATYVDESLAVSSSGTMSTNTIQALYDVGLTCPARLEC
jgi:hypothetical protein